MAQPESRTALQPSETQTSKEDELPIESPPSHDWENALRPDPGEERDFEVENNPFAFSPGQLNKLLNPKSLAAFKALGGLSGLEIGLRTDSQSGLSVDETDFKDSVRFWGATVSSHLRPGSPPSNAARTSMVPENAGDAYSDRKRVYGRNRLPEKRRKSFSELVWIACQDKVVILLTTAAVISLVLGIYRSIAPGPNISRFDWVEGVAILVAIGIVVGIDAVNDYQKERQFVKLNTRKEERMVKVVRSGKAREISVYDILVGDVMHLEPGDLVPVDGIFIDGHNVKCDESSATGESDVLRKTPAHEAYHTIQQQGNLSKIDPFIISGAKIMEGVGTFLVTSVGTYSSYGRIIMSFREEDEDDTTPLQTKLNILAGYISKIGFAASFMLLAILVIRFLAQSTLVRLVDDKSLPLRGICLGVVIFIPVAFLLTTPALIRHRSRMTVAILEACVSMENTTTICENERTTIRQDFEVHCDCPPDPGEQPKEILQRKSRFVYKALRRLRSLGHGLKAEGTSSSSTHERRLSGNETYTSKAGEGAEPPTPGREEGNHAPFYDRIRFFNQNQLPKKTSFLKLLWMGYDDKAIISLTIIAIVSLFLGIYETIDSNEGVNWIESVAICVTILIVTIVTALNDWQKERQFVKRVYREELCTMVPEPTDNGKSNSATLKGVSEPEDQSSGTSANCNDPLMQSVASINKHFNHHFYKRHEVHEPYTMDTIGQRRSHRDQVRSRFTHSRDAMKLDSITQQRSRFMVPLRIRNNEEDALPDTGADENAISSACVSQLGLTVEPDVNSESSVTFRLANGRVIQSCGVVKTPLCFAKGTRNRSETPVLFRVFQKLAVPMIVGRKFLKDTETLTRHTNRLKKVAIPLSSALPRIFHLNTAKERILCYVNGIPVCANADTGAEMNLASPEWAARHNVAVRKPDPGYEEVMLADGSRAPITGQFHARFQVHDASRKEAKHRTSTRQFFILDGLTSDILLCQDLLFDIRAFKDQQDSFVEIDAPAFCSDINLVTWLSKGEKRLLGFFKLNKDPNMEAVQSDGAFRADLDDADAREQYVHKQAKLTISKLPEPERSRRLEVEMQRHGQYLRNREKLERQQQTLLAPR